MTQVINQMGAALDWEIIEQQMKTADEELLKDVKRNVARIPQAQYNVFTMRYAEKHGKAFAPDLEKK